jgi:hypothetical protein
LLYYFMLPGIWLPAPIPTSNLPLPTSHFVDAPGTVPFASVSPSLRLGHLGGASSGVSLQQLRQRKKDPYKGIKYIQLTPNVHNIDTQIFYYRLGHITNRRRGFGTLYLLVQRFFCIFYVPPRKAHDEPESHDFSRGSTSKAIPRKYSGPTKPLRSTGFLVCRAASSGICPASNLMLRGENE